MHSEALKQRERYFFLLVIVTGFFLFLNLINYGRPTSKRHQRLNEEVTNNTTGIREHLDQLYDFQEFDLNIEKSDLSTEDLLNYTENALTNFPVSFWREHKDKKMFYKNKTCAQFPNLYLLKVNNLYWQMLNTKNGTFYILSAYYDNRKRNLGGPCVRLIGMTDHYVMPRTYCHIWFANRTEPVIVETMSNIFQENDSQKPHYRLYYGYSSSCVIPDYLANQVPLVVSLVEKMCDIASNAVRVVYKKPSKAGKKDRFGVCVRTLDFFHSDKSVRLVEWIELVKLMGAEKIHFYYAHIHKNMTKVLEYYVQKGAAEMTPMTLAGSQINLAGFQHLYNYYMPNIRTEFANEVISLNDCILKNMHTYEYIAVLDIDEIIMPLRVDNWLDLMKEVSNQTLSSKGEKTKGGYHVHMIHFPTACDGRIKWQDDIPHYMFMLQHVLRNQTRPYWYCPKSFINTDLVTSVSNHYARSCLPSGDCSNFGVDEKDALTLHYHTPLEIKDKSCDDMTLVNDTTLWRFKRPLVNRTLQVLSELGFLRRKNMTKQYGQNVEE